MIQSRAAELAQHCFVKDAICSANEKFGNVVQLFLIRCSKFLAFMSKGHQKYVGVERCSGS